MKIAILVLQFPPRVLAGTEIATYNIARHLVRRCHRVYVITSRDRGLPGESLEQGFSVHRLSIPRVKVLGIAVFWLKALFRLWALKPDVVHGQDIGMGVAGFLAERLLRTPYVVWGRGTNIYDPWLLKQPISKLVLKNASAVIALTGDMKEQMQRIYRRDVAVIPNGVDLDTYRNLPAKAVARAKLGLVDDRRILLFVGTLRPVKGLTYLIEAMAIIRQQNATANLVVVGDGELRRSLEGLVEKLALEDTVAFIGRVPNEKVPEYMAAADVLVLPSLSEGFPNVLLEAMAAGLPIVASRIGGVPEIVEEGRNGFLVEPGNVAQIADRVLMLLIDPTLRARLGQTNMDDAKRYSWQDAVGQLEAVYRRVLEARNREQARS